MQSVSISKFLFSKTSKFLSYSNSIRANMSIGMTIISRVVSLSILICYEIFFSIENRVFNFFTLYLVFQVHTWWRRHDAIKDTNNNQIFQNNKNVEGKSHIFFAIPHLATQIHFSLSISFLFLSNKSKLNLAWSDIWSKC